MLQVAYMTKGGGGYIGLDLYDVNGTYLGEQWLIGDGSFPDLSTWDYWIGNTNPALLNVWKVYQQPYTIPANVYSVRVKTEDYVNGLPNDPTNHGVFFDDIGFVPGNQLSLFETFGSLNPSELHRCQTCAGEPINTATGNFFEDFTDIAIPGRGLPLDFTRTYNSLGAGINSPLGYGWSASYFMSLTASGNLATVNQENGSQVTFTLSNGTYSAPPRVEATLVHNGDGTYLFTRRSREFFTFDSSGKWIRVQDLDGRAATPPYATTLSYNSSGQLVTVTDPVSRTLTLAWWPSGLLKSITDSGSPSRVVSFAYNDGQGNLTDVTNVGGGVTHFTYDSSHRLVTELDPNQAGSSSPVPMTNHYDSSGRVDWQTDFLGRKTTFDYATVPGATLISDPKLNQTLDVYQAGELVRVIKGYGTPQAATWKYVYDPATLGVTSVTDPNGHVITSSYDAQGNLLVRTVDPNGLNRVTRYTYDTLNDLTSVTDPKNVQTAMTYDANGNLLTASTPLYAADGVTVLGTKTTTNHYTDPAHPGDVITTTDPDNKVWSSSYDANGDLASSTDPLGDKTASCYDAIGRRTEVITPLGASGFTCPASPPGRADYTTIYTYNAFSQVLVTTDPFGNQTVRTYDADQNLASLTEPPDFSGTNVTHYTYDAANELSKITRADQTTLRYDYWPDGTLKTQYDGANQPTGYTYDPLGHLASVTDPLGRTTNFVLDAVGNMLSKAVPGGSCTGTTSGCTTYGYDHANELQSSTYSDGTTPNVTNITYDADGQRKSITDGTGTSTYNWDSLHRLTSNTNGAGQTVSYGYDLKGQLTSITYPGGVNTVTRAFDDAGRLHTVQDWLNHVTTFNYDADSNLQTENHPNGVVDTYSSDKADRLFEIKDTSGSTELADFAYARNAHNFVDGSNQWSGNVFNSYSYTPLNQLANNGFGSYQYDAADNPIQLAVGDPNGPSEVNQYFDAANQLKRAAPQITLVGTAKEQDPGTTNPVTLSLPSGIQASDQILVAVTTAQNGSATSTPPGYTLAGSWDAPVNGGDRMQLFRRTATGGEPNVSISFPNTAVHAKAVIATVYRGVDPTSPIEAQSAGTAVTSNTVTAPSITTTSPGDELVAFQSALNTVSGSTWSPPAGVGGGSMSEETQADSLPLSSAGVADQLLTAPGSTGSQSSSLAVSATTNDSLVMVLLALKPAFTSFTYSNLGERTAATPPTGSAATLTYDQVSRLVSYGHGTTTATYTYDGDGLRASKIVGAGPSAVTTPYTWDVAEGLPLLLYDGTADYVYGPGGTAIEQIQATPVISLVGTSSATDVTGTASSVKVNLPGGLKANDQIVIQANQQQGQTAVTPIGFTAVGNQATGGSAGSRVQLFVHTATGSESSVTLTYTSSPIGSPKVALAAVYRNVDPTTPIDGVSSAAASGTSITLPSITTTTDGDELAAALAASRSTLPGSFTPPSGFANRVNASTAPDNNTGDFADKAQGAAGVTSDQTATFSRSAPLVGILFALRRAPIPVQYLHQDQLGSIRMVTDSAGSALGTVTFDPYGIVVSRTGTVSTPFGFAGEYTDSESGFQYLRARYYDPATAQFLSRDPAVSATQQPYGYATGNPLNGVDPAGLLNLPGGYCIHIPFMSDNCDTLWKEHPALHGPVTAIGIVGGAALLTAGCLAGGCAVVAAAAASGGAWLSNTVGAECENVMPSFPDDVIPDGLTRNEWGTQIWGVGSGDAEALIGTRSAATLRALGLTVENAVKLRDFYAGVAAAGLGGAAAPARVDLLNNIIETLQGG